MRTFIQLGLLLCFTGAGLSVSAEPSSGPSALGYPSLQAAIDANPGKPLFLPAGDYRIDRALEIRTANSGLFGPGRIIQTNPAARIIYVVNAQGVQLRDLTLTRGDAAPDTLQHALLAEHCRELTLDNLQVLDNHGAVSIRLSGCTHCQVRNCLVRNYTGVSVDDRTRQGEFGVAFNCLDGTGIQIDNSVGTLVSGNRVIESRLIGTPELHNRHALGLIVKRSTKPGAVPPANFARPRVQNWHQGSAIHIANPEVSDCTQVIGNYIENAGQGIDVHADHTLISGNIIHNAFIGLKAMHGARHVSIVGNQFSKIDLWGILLQPGSASHPGRDATATSAARPPNRDGGSIVANNIITDFGFGNEYWNWREANGFPIVIQSVPETHIPPLADVLVTGNLVYDTGRDQVVDGGKLVPAGPRYKHALCISQGPNAPQNVIVSGNLLHPGQEGVSNVDLQRYRPAP